MQQVTEKASHMETLNNAPQQGGDFFAPEQPYYEVILDPTVLGPPAIPGQRKPDGDIPFAVELMAPATAAPELVQPDGPKRTKYYGSTKKIRIKSTAPPAPGKPQDQRHEPYTDTEKLGDIK